MKVIEKSLQTLPQSALRVAAAMETAATTVVEQGRTFAAEVTACATSLSADMKAIADQMAAIPALLDPEPILACCTEVLETAASDLRRLATDAAAIPQRLVAQTALVQQVVDQAADAAKALCDLLPTLAELVPDFSPQLSFFNSLPARGNALAGQAMRSSALLEQYGSQLLPLSAQLGVSGAAGGASQLLQSQALALQRDSLAHVALLRGTLQSDAADLELGVVDASAKVSQTILAVANLVREKGDQLMAPLQAQIALVDQVKDALRDEAAACDALFDDGMAQLDRLGDILLKPVTAARAQVDAVIDQLAAAAASVDAMVRKALTPLDALERRVEAISQALEDAVGVVGEEVTQVRVLLAELDTEADDAKAILMALPENFVPVRTMIAEAVALLVEIQGRIPGFVAEASRALDDAAAELDQAEVLCNHAIEICTLHMMKAPSLMLARTLFVGVKAMIPSVKGAIASARQSVKTAGTQASGLIEQAIALVQALKPLLDQAIAEVQVAIEALVDLLEQLQTALHQVSDAAGAIPPALLQQIEAASTALRTVLDKVRAAADECLVQLQCEALVRRLQQQLRDLLDRTFDPLDAKIREASGPLRQALQKGREDVAQAAELAQEGLRGLGQVLSDTEDAAQQPVTQLADTVVSWEPRMTSMGSTAQQKISQTAAQALSLVDQVAQKIAGLNIGALAMPPGAVAMLDGVSAAFSQVQSDASSAADKRASIDSWVTDARQVVAPAAASIDNAVTEVRQGIAEVQSASDRTRADARAASDSMSDDASVAAQVEASFDGMKQDAQAVADSANAALDGMSGSLEEARAQSETVVDSYAPVSQRALADAQVQFDGATEIAEEAKKSEQALADEIAAAEQNVGAASRDAGTQTTDLKDTAQAGINKTLDGINSVQAQVEAARTDVIAAEAIVDAEVVKYGGTTSRIDPVVDPVAEGKDANEASTSASAAASTAASTSASNVATSGAADQAAGVGSASANSATTPATDTASGSGVSGSGEAGATPTGGAGATATSGNDAGSADDKAVPASAGTNVPASEATASDTVPPSAPPRARKEIGSVTSDAQLEATPSDAATTDSMPQSAASAQSDGEAALGAPSGRPSANAGEVAAAKPGAPESAADAGTAPAAASATAEVNADQNAAEKSNAAPGAQRSGSKAPETVGDGAAVPVVPAHEKVSGDDTLSLPADAAAKKGAQEPKAMTPPVGDISPTANAAVPSATPMAEVAMQPQAANTDGDDKTGAMAMADTAPLLKASSARKAAGLADEAAKLLPKDDPIAMLSAAAKQHSAAQTAVPKDAAAKIAEALVLREKMLAAAKSATPLPDVPQ